MFPFTIEVPLRMSDAVTKNGRLIGYARVSTSGQNLNLQGTSIYCCERHKCKADGTEKPECTRST